MRGDTGSGLLALATQSLGLHRLSSRQSTHACAKLHLLALPHVSFLARSNSTRSNFQSRDRLDNPHSTPRSPDVNLTFVTLGQVVQAPNLRKIILPGC